MFRFLVSWAFEKGKMPDEVLEQYKKNPKNFKLLMAYSKYENERQEQERKEQERKSGDKGTTIKTFRPG